MRKVLSVFIALCLVLSLCTGFMAQVAAGAIPKTWYVAPATASPAGSDSNLGTVEAPFLTIQHAVGVAGVGDTIDVAIGIYPEKLQVFDKTGLTIQGKGDTSLIEPAYDDIGTAGITIRSSSGLTIQDLKIHTAGRENQGIWVYGLLDGGSAITDLTIHDVTIRADGPTDGLLAASGIIADGAAAIHSGWHITDNTISAAGAGSCGMVLQDVSASTISGNTITIPNAISGTNVLWSSERLDLADLVFSGNTVSGSIGSQVAILTDFNHRDPPTNIPSENPLVHSKIVGVTISGNTFSNWGSPGSGRALRIGTAYGTGTVTAITITSNTFNMTEDRPEVIGGTAAPSATGSGNTFNVSSPATIQKAVTAAFAGDTINVAAGTYPENVTVNKALTLAGAGSGSVTVTAANPAVSVFTISASNVTMSGFTATGAGGTPPTGNQGYSGIRIDPGVQNCNIHDNVLTGNQYGILLTETENSTTLGNNVFTSNTASSNGTSGIEMQHTYGNTFTSNTANSNSGYGFKLDSSRGNTFTSNTANLNQRGFYLTTDVGIGSNGNTFTGNTANLNTRHGIHLIGISNDVTMTGNTFSGNTTTGVKLQGTVNNLSMTHTNVTGSPTGIHVSNESAPDLPNVTGWTVEHNNISGNTLGVYNRGAGTLNAAQNWWGHASGPYNLTSNPSGTGNTVSDNVTFCQWSLDSGSASFNVQAITTTSPLATGTSGVAYSQTLAGSGGMLPYTWSISSGSLPTGLTLTESTGVIAGTPTVPGVFTFTVTCTSVCSAPTKVLTITIKPVITATAGTGGTITPSGAVALVLGANQSFAIAASPGYSVLGVSVDGAPPVVMSSYTFTNVTANHTIAATFVPGALSYFIDTTAPTGGSITPGDTWVPQFGSQSFAIAPTNGYHIENVVVDSESKGAITSWDFTNVVANHTIAATFSATDIVVTAGPFVTVPLAASPNGTGYIGAAVDYTLGGADHDRVASVSVALYDAVSGGNKMVENTSKSAGRVNNEEQGPGYTSAFRVKIGTYTVSSTWNLGAWATTPTRTVVPARAVITVTDVDGWTYVVENTTFLNTPPSHVTWASLFPTLTYTAGANGTISGTTPQAILSYGANGTLVTAVADVGYHFVKWSDNNSTTAARTDTDVQGDITTTASFAINTYTLTVNKTGNGTVVSDPTPVAGKYDHGTVVTLTVTPDAGWHFESWTGATCQGDRHHGC
jgi:parallel beta-helix repeat protein